jgi:ribosome maturation factor RimP
MALTNQKIERSLLPGAQALGVELVAVEMAGGDQTILRVYIDKEGGISVEDCAKASRQFSAILDVEDPISSRYTLEVSSPGLDRPLARPKHFQAVVGEEVKVRMASLAAGRKRFKGELKSASDESIIVDVDGTELELAYADMDKARLVATYDFTRVLDEQEADS